MSKYWGIIYTCIGGLFTPVSDEVQEGSAFPNVTIFYFPSLTSLEHFYFVVIESIFEGRSSYSLRNLEMDIQDYSRK